MISNAHIYEDQLSRPHIYFEGSFDNAEFREVVTGLAWALLSLRVTGVIMKRFADSSPIIRVVRAESAPQRAVEAVSRAVPVLREASPALQTVSDTSEVLA